MINKIYYIVGNKSERINNVNSQTLIHKLDNVILYDAVIGNNMNIYQTPKFTSGMIGCYISHFSLWKECIRNNEGIVMICEDDNTFNMNFQERLDKALEILPEDFDFALLSSYGSPDENVHPKNIHPLDNYWCKKKSWFGTNCYLVNTTNLKEKIHLFNKMQYQIDIQMGVLARQDKLTLYHLTKNLSLQMGMQTTVQK